MVETPQMKTERSMPTRWTLVERLKNPADETSWNEFVQIYSGLIHGVARKAGLTECEAEEALQETLISVSKSVAKFEANPSSGSFKGFLLQIASRRIVDQFRKRPRQHHVSASLRDDSRTATIDRLPDPTQALQEIWNAEWEKHSREGALRLVKQQADPAQFQMFELHVLQGNPVREVAARLGVSQAQVYFARHKIARALKAALKRRKSQAETLR